MSQETNVPKLQVPKLKDSLKAFLTAMKQLISERSFLEIVKATDLFASNEAPSLQNKLLALAEETVNWASDLWVDSRFLSNRSSLLFTNGLFTPHNKLVWHSVDDMLISVSVFILSLMNLVENIRNDTLPQEMIGGVPLCMQQYSKFGSVNRSVGKSSDKHTQFQKSKHIVVLYGGNIFKMPVYTGGSILSLHEAFHLLDQVIKCSKDSTDPVLSIGILTADRRDGWYSSRQELVRSPVNLESLKAIEESLFGICLDEPLLSDLFSIPKACRFGDGTGKFDIVNRWFDLGFQAAFTRDGYTSFINEHSLFDGSVIANILANILPKLGPKDFAPREINVSLKIELLKWDVSLKTLSQMREMKIRLSHWFTAYDAHAFNFELFGKDFIKQQGLYFHGFIHLAIQLAYFKLYKKLVATFIPISLRKFLGGRLEHPHTLSEESKIFVQAMCDVKIGNREKRDLMKGAIFSLKKTMAETSNGQVYFKHILALKKLAEQEHLSIELFENPNFEVFSCHKLAISSVFFPEPIIGTYPNSQLDQHYVIYLSTENSIFYLVTTVHDSLQSVSSEEFVRELESALSALYHLILTESPVKSKL